MNKEKITKALKNGNIEWRRFKNKEIK